MIKLRSALRAVLGETFQVTHAGSPVTVSVAYAGKEDAAVPLPAVFIEPGYGDGKPENIGGRARSDLAFCDLTIQTLDTDTVDGAILVEDIHQKIEDLVCAAERTIADSFFTHTGPYRDFPPVKLRAEPEGTVLHSYKRAVTVRAQKLRSY